MERKVILQAAMIAALVATVAVVVMAIATFSLPASFPLQPVVPQPPGVVDDLPLDWQPIALGFFGADSLFLLSYALVFVGLYIITAERARPFALVGLGLGFLAAFFDAVENAAYIIDILRNAYLASDTPLVYIVTNLKWMAAFGALYAFGLVLPRRGIFEWLLTGLLLAFPVVGVLGVVHTGLIPVRSLFLLVGMPLFAAYLWRQYRQSPVD